MSAIRFTLFVLISATVAIASRWNAARRGYESAPNIARFASPATTMAWTPNATQLVGILDDTTSCEVRFWNRSSMALRRFVVGPGAIIAFSSDGKWLAIACSSRNTQVSEFQLWELPRMELRDGWTIRGRPRLLALSDDGSQVAVLLENTRTVELHDSRTGRLSRKLTGEGLVTAIDFQPQTAAVALLGFAQRSSLGLWRGYAYDDIESGMPATAVAFAPGGSLLATGYGDGRVRLWDVTSNGNASLRRRCEIAGEAAVASLAFSHNATRLAIGTGRHEAGSWSGEVKVVRTADRCLEKTLGGHPLPVASVAFTTDDRQLASASLDGTARLWRLQ